MSPDDQAILDLCGDVARILQGQNLVIATPTPTRNDSANLRKKPTKPNRWVQSQIDDAQKDAIRNRMVAAAPSGNTLKPPKTDSHMTATKTTTPIRLKCQPLIDEYRSNHLYLRERGISLADYVRTAMRDEHGGNYELHTDLRELLDTIQLKAFGGVADPMRPLDAVV